MNVTADEFIAQIKPELKLSGYKKYNQTWRKNNKESISVFNVQKSQWDDCSFYVNVGVYYKKLGNDLKPTENLCHVQSRINTDDWGTVVITALSWLRQRESLSDAKLLAEDDSKKGLVVKELRKGNLG
jgi:hypothetical protein